MKHKWYNEIVAWAGGEKIEVCKAGVWYQTDYPDFHHTGLEFRIKPQPKEPVLVNATTHDGQTYKIEVSAPNREWVGLSDDEIEEVFNLGHKTFKEFARAIEAKLKEKNELFGNSR